MQVPHNFWREIRFSLEKENCSCSPSSHDTCAMHLQNFFEHPSKFTPWLSGVDSILLRSKLIYRMAECIYWTEDKDVANYAQFLINKIMKIGDGDAGNTNL